MSSILDVSSMYSAYSGSVGNISADNTKSTLNQLNKDSSDEELMEACKGFESYFVQKMIESAKKTLDNEDEQGEYMQYFSDTLNQTYADLIADSGQIGLAQQLYDSMKNTYNI